LDPPARAHLAGGEGAGLRQATFACGRESAAERSDEPDRRSSLKAGGKSTLRGAREVPTMRSACLHFTSLCDCARHICTDFLGNFKARCVHNWITCCAVRNGVSPPQIILRFRDIWPPVSGNCLPTLCGSAAKTSLLAEGRSRLSLVRTRFAPSSLNHRLPGGCSSMSLGRSRLCRLRVLLALPIHPHSPYPPAL
jgi:hypothetical protein